MTCQGFSTKTAEGADPGAFFLEVPGRAGDELAVRVSGDHDGGNVSVVAVATVEEDPSSPTLGRLSERPLVVRRSSPLTVSGRVTVAVPSRGGTLPACGVEVLVNGRRGRTDVRGDFALTSVPTVRQGGALQGLTATATRPLPPSTFAFTGTAQVSPALVEAALAAPARPAVVSGVAIVLTGPGPSPGTPATPGAA